MRAITVGQAMGQLMIMKSDDDRYPNKLAEQIARNEARAVARQKDRLRAEGIKV